MPIPSRGTILLVDDNPSVRLIISAGLRANGFDVLAAGTAEKALAFCEGFDGTIDILLSDIGLTPPDLWATETGDEAIPHGVALAVRARQIRPSLKVVLFTGYSDERLNRLTGEIKEFPVLRKPCELTFLIQTFRQLLEGTAARG